MCDTSFQKAQEMIWKQSELTANHFVSRFNACVVVQGALLAFAVRPVLGAMVSGATFWERIVGFVVAISGVLLSLFSLRVLLGAYFWASYWEDKLAKIDEKVFPDIEVFRNLPNARNKKLLKELAESSSHLRYHGSPRKAMLAIFKLFLAIWLILLLAITISWRLSIP
jgi:hypothetical protein